MRLPTCLIIKPNNCDSNKSYVAMVSLSMLNLHLIFGLDVVVANWNLGK